MAEEQMIPTPDPNEQWDSVVLMELHGVADRFRERFPEYEEKSDIDVIQYLLGRAQSCFECNSWLPNPPHPGELRICEDCIRNHPVPEFGHACLVGPKQEGEPPKDGTLLAIKFEGSPDPVFVRFGGCVRFLFDDPKHYRWWSEGMGYPEDRPIEWWAPINWEEVNK